MKKCILFMMLLSKFLTVFGQSKDNEIISFLNSYKKFEETGKRQVGTIAHCLPNSFEFYGVVTHPYEIATNLPDSIITLKQHESRVPYDFDKAKQRNRVVGDVSFTTTDEQGRVIDIFELQRQKYEWKDQQTWRMADWSYICSKNGLVFNEKTTLNSIWKSFSKNGIPYNLEYPEEGTLNSAKFKLICEIIGQDSLYNKIYVYQTPPNSIKGNDTLMLMKIEDAIMYFNEGFRGYICAQDKSFVLFTDTDLQFSLWGSNKLLADRLKLKIEMLPAKLDYKLVQ